MENISILRYLKVLLVTSSLVLEAISINFAQTRFDTFISVTHNDSLDATYFYPSQPPPPSGYPALLTVHGFGLNKESRIPFCSTYAANGYITFTYSVRGHGHSTGKSTVMSRRERNDLSIVLGYLRQLPGVDSSSIGIVGSSQGGLHGLWSAADNLPVKAICSDVIVPAWASDMLMNGCVRRTLPLLLSTTTVHYDSTINNLWEYVRTDKYDSLLARFPADRDVDTTRLHDSSIPIMLMLKWQDHYFTAGDGMNYFQQQPAGKKLYIGTEGHWSDTSMQERLFQDNQIFRWLNYYLKEEQNGILDEPPIQYAYSSLPMDDQGYFDWIRAGAYSLPPDGIQPVKFYFCKDSALSYSPPTTIDTFVLSNKYLNSAYTFDTAFVEGFKGSRFDAILPKCTVVFVSPALDNEIIWFGAPKMKLYLKSDYEHFPIHAQVYEIDSTGNKYFINRINFTARHWTPGTDGWIDVKGIPHAHKFRKGHRIRVELTNIDKTNRPMLGNYPFVVPLFSDVSTTIISDNSNPSYIELPLIGSPTSVEPLSGLPPSSLLIVSNYPNPFNLSTKIKYNVQSKEYVSIKVYDVLGREVSTLVNEVKQPGIYTVQWDASASGGLASGIYFSRLTAGDFTDIKKLILLR